MRIKNGENVKADDMGKPWENTCSGLDSYWTLIMSTELMK